MCVTVCLSFSSKQSHLRKKCRIDNKYKLECAAITGRYNNNIGGVNSLKIISGNSFGVLWEIVYLEHRLVQVKTEAQKMSLPSNIFKLIQRTFISIIQIINLIVMVITEY